MGDRGNIKVGDIYLYTHWRGSRITNILKCALVKGKSRWDNEAYLTRIIFCELMKGEEDGIIGYGISTDILDNQREILEVDCKNQLIKFGKINMSFEEYIDKL